MNEKRKNILEDVNVCGGAARGVSDHYLVEAKIRMKGFRKRDGEEVIAKSVMMVSELQKQEVRKAFLILIVNEFDRIRNTRVLSVEEEWQLFKSTVMPCAARVHWYKSIERKKRGSARWDEEIKEMVRDKKRFI